MDDETEMSLIVSFTDQSEGFVHGFEAGMIWQQLESESMEPIDRGYETGFPIHTENLPLIVRMAKARGFKVETKPEDVEGWTPVLLTYVGEGRAKPVLGLVAGGKHD